MQIKKELLVGVLGTFLVIALTGYYTNKYQQITTKRSIITTPVNTAPSASSTANTQTQQTLVLSIQEIAKHNTSSDCWVIVNQSVYNVTVYLVAHPGGAGIIIPYCGADATAAYDTKGGRGSHSSNADQDLASLKLGNVNQSIVTSSNQASGNSGNTILGTTPSSLQRYNNRREYEDDD
jgi:cytochrome b involved in lipid metabolism